ncbi:hypothetical protein [Bradyrhizobium sp. CB1015]|uniref:hypothetical protein n=1 Tax=Bradyrhizobium sp. CB1015 TaxID=2976822 RepID=UPI0021A9EEB6|nr:hypothetical protein [Bradyrhizobium sp. CB1015]UWU88987.1 hypothetical protein N2604_20895 [Bradyrhizobium sp. CB1015]
MARLEAVHKKRKDENTVDRSSVSQSSGRQMLPVLSLSEQLPASLGIARGSLSAKQRHCAKSAGNFHSNLPLYFVFQHIV